MKGQGQILNLPIDIKRSGYAVYAKGGEDETAEIKMYGEVVRSRPVDGWTGKKIEGNFIIEDEIIADLEKLAGKKEIRIRMNSVGGACDTAIVIHNRLREMSLNGTKIVCTVDGVAMSAGSHIMCAADVVKASAGSLVMIHKSIVCFFFARMNADELRKLAMENDAYDKVIVEAYKRKTGKSEEELLEMMSATTYLTGREAKEKGFVDELIEDDESTAQVAASADRKTLYCNGQAMFLGNMCVPDFIPVIPPNANGGGEIIKNQSDNDADENKTGGNLMANNLKELRAENSALASAVEADIKAELENTLAAEKTEAINKAIADAIQNERQRLSDIEKFAPGIPAEMVKEAMFGKTACDYKELLARDKLRQLESGKSFIADMTADFEDSKVAGVGAAPEPIQGGAMTEKQRRAAIDKCIDELGLEEDE